MTEDEAKKELFRIHQEYMMHSPKERLKLYDEYKEKRKQIKLELARFLQQKEGYQKKL